MKRSPLVVSLVVSVLIGVIAFVATLGVGWTPKLGIDLAGGSEVIFQPARPVNASEMSSIVNVITNRANGAGVSNAVVEAQGGNVVVQLPAVKDPASVIAQIGKTGQMTFRPVLCSASTQTQPPKTGALPTTCTAGTELNATNLNPTVDSNGLDHSNQVPSDPNLAGYPSTNPDNDAAGSTVLLPVTGGGRYLLGPAGLTGKDITKASAQLSSAGVWAVDASLNSAGSTAWDQLAQAQFHAMIAIDLGGTIISAPITQPGQATFSSFQGQVQISGSFTQGSAQSLAQSLNYGSLPVALKPIPLSQQTVTPTLGKASLKAGLAAGIGGLLLVLIYTILYYRALGVVVVSGLALTSMILWAFISALGHSSLHITLDLAGVTGLIVSVGITVDSYIVYFERLKDEARAGRSVRSSVTKSFQGAFRTVLAADLVSFLAAAVLWLIAAGSVKGFAFFLGISTILDVATTWFFTRPLVILLGRSRTVTDARIIGIARGLAIDSGGQA